MTNEAHISFRNIRKSFPGVVALDDINLDIERGKINALLGENGAGKSTLVNILYGLYRQDGGDIYLNGVLYDNRSPKNAIQNGIGMIHQHFMLIPGFSILENIILGLPSPNPLKLDREHFRQKIQEVADGFGIVTNLDEKVQELGFGMQQKIEILKTLYKGVELLILDEPTTMLTPQESRELFKILEELNRRGVTIIFISHKLNEVMQICHKINVLRDGKLIDSVDKAGTSPHELSKLMVSRTIKAYQPKKHQRKGENELRLENISLIDRHDERRLLKNISLHVRQGEIVGIAGIDENGQKELAEIICGLRKPSSGRMMLSGNDVTQASTRQLIEMGISCIPADRRSQALVMDFSITDNSILKTHYQSPFTRGCLLQKKIIRQFAAALVREYDVRTPHLNVPMKNLSGGNQQKVIIGREFSNKIQVLIAMQPTWGLDVGAVEFVHNKLLEARENGIMILLISTDLEEIRKLSDRILVIYEGEMVGQADSGTSIEEIGLMMAGSKRQAASR